MSKKVQTVAPDESVYDSVMLMDKYNIGALVVTDGKDVKGILSERDIIRKVLARNKDIRKTKVQDAMTPDVKSLGPDDSVLRAINLMDRNRFRHVVVLEKGQLVGILTATDLIKLSAY